MATTRAMEPGGLFVVRIQGQLTDEDSLRNLFAATTEAQYQGKISVLIVLDGFEGWAEGHWDDPEVQRIDTELRQSVERVAVVGPVVWKDQWLLFLGYADTPTEIRYFGDGEDGMARAWLGGSQI